MKQHILKLKANKQFSSRFLITLLVSSFALFLLFFLVGFNMPSLVDPSLNEPLLTTPLLVFVYLVMILGIAVAIWSVIKEMLLGNHLPSIVNGIAVKKLNRLVFIGVFGVLLINFFISSGKPIKVNGSLFQSTFLLKMSDMFIFTSIFLLSVASLVALWGMLKNYKRG